jgi:acyl-CoA thioesterase FadM
MTESNFASSDQAVTYGGVVYPSQCDHMGHMNDAGLLKAAFSTASRFLNNIVAPKAQAFTRPNLTDNIGA